jgi:4a-hydroxytetrahydrobiopterin dehydratase
MSSVSKNELLAGSCKGLEGGHALQLEDITAQLEVLEGWVYKADAIERSYHFENYYETMAFLNAVAYVVHREDHHPDITFGYNQAVLRFNTHSVKGISLNDFICAAKCDALYAARPASPS